MRTKTQMTIHRVLHHLNNVDKKIINILWVVLLSIAITQGMSLLFRVIPSELKEFHFISNTPFYFRQDIPITPRSFVWRLFEKANTAVYFWLIYFAVTRFSDKAKHFLIPFVIMKGLLLVEYVLSYNSPWFSLGLFGHSFRIGLSHFFIIFTFIILGRIIYIKSYARRNS